MDTTAATYKIWFDEASSIDAMFNNVEMMEDFYFGHLHEGIQCRGFLLVDGRPREKWVGVN